VDSTRVPLRDVRRARQCSVAWPNRFPADISSVPQCVKEFAFNTAPTRLPSTSRFLVRHLVVVVRRISVARCLPRQLRYVGRGTLLVGAFARLIQCPTAIPPALAWSTNCFSSTRFGQLAERRLRADAVQQTLTPIRYSRSPRRLTAEARSPR